MQNLENADPAQLRAMVLERLRFERLMGVEVVPRVAVTIARAVAAAPAPLPVRSVPAVSPPQRSATSARDAAAAQLAASASRTIPPSQSAPVRTAVVAPAAAVVSRPSNAAERWRVLEEKALACTACVLAQGRTNVVFGTGNRAADLLFIGEGPGQDEDLRGEPFVGKAGQLLDKIIGAMGLKREDVYICNVVKCRPPQNRTPLPDEVAACSPYLMAQIELVAPKVIVALGSPAAKALLNTATGITALRGRWHAFRGIPVMPTFHPAFVLRQYTAEVRGQVWGDMQQVMERLKGNP